MYIYFDRTGKIKEVINDEALRQGNYGVNKLYIYIARDDVSSIDITYLLPSKLIVGPQNYSEREEAEIPFDQKRDLYWFKYHETYNFFVIDLEEDVNGNAPLDEAGLVHCDMQMNLENTQIYTLGELNFNVEVNSVLNQKQVANQEYLSLSNYLFLRTLVGQEKVPYTGATDNVDLGQYSLKAKELAMIDAQNNGVMIEMYDDKVSFTVYEEGIAHHNFYLPTNPLEQTTTFATQEWVTPQLPAKQVAGQFNTDDFEDDMDHNTQVIDVNVNLINGSDLLVITWGGCFAICPLPASGPGRVCAALWNANGESQIVRIRYQLFTMGSQKILQITLPGNFQLPENFTGYVISYKIA